MIYRTVVFFFGWLASMATVAAAQTPEQIGRQLILQSQQAAAEQDVEKATRLLDEALSYPLPPTLVDSLVTDIADILSDEQREALEKSESVPDFLRRFWREVDPTPATPENERYVEHYRRLRYAREHYPSAEKRGYDDRGMIYVRFGAPDEVFTQPSDNFFRGTESWVYRRLGDVNFDFIEFGATYDLSSDFRRALVAVPFDVHDQIRIMRDFFSERSELGVNYSRAYDRLQRELDLEAQTGKPPDLLLVNQLVSKFMQEVEDRLEKLPPSTTDVGREARTLQFGFSFARFYEEGGNRLELYYGVPLRELEFLPDSSGAGLLTHLDLKFRILDEELNPVVQDQKHIALQVHDRAEIDTIDYVGQLTFFLEPGTYRVALQLGNPEAQKKQYFLLRIKLDAFAPLRLTLSDLQFAKRVLEDTSVVEFRGINGEARGFFKRGLFIEPYPYALIARDRPVELYYEIYNLAQNRKGKSQYEVEYKILGEKRGGGIGKLLKSINPFSRGAKTSVTTSYRREANEPFQHERLKLDFSDLEPGNYLLQVTLKDKISSESVQKIRRFRLVKAKDS